MRIANYIPMKPTGETRHKNQKPETIIFELSSINLSCLPKFDVNCKTMVLLLQSTQLTVNNDSKSRNN